MLKVYIPVGKLDTCESKDSSLYSKLPEATLPAL